MSTSNLKISIAALSLCVSAVAIYIHLPYVIAAVSGSGAIEAVPLAIFAVSAIVALVSVICLIRLAVSRAGDKKKKDPSGEESGHTASQVLQEKSVKQDSRSQTDVARAIPQNNNASSPSPSGGPPPPPPAPSSNGTPLSKKANSSGVDVKASAAFNKIRQRLDKQEAEKLGSNGDRQQQNLVNESNAEFKSSGSNTWERTSEDIDREQAKRRKENLSSQGDSLFGNAIRHTLLERRKSISLSSDSNLSSPPDSNGWSSSGDEEQDKQSSAPAQADAPIEATYEIDSDEELRNCKMSL